MTTISIFLVVLGLGLTLGQNFDRGVIGVGFSPYVDPHPWRNWDQYSVEDIKKMLRVIGNRFDQISTYSMGVQQWCINGPWDRCDSNSLVARSAAQLNRDTGSNFRVNIGIYQNDNQNYVNKEIDNAFAAANEANQIARNSVWGITFTNEYVTDNRGQQVLDMIRRNKGRARNQNLKVGARIHTCGELVDGGQLQNIIRQIVQESDFIYCNVYASKEHARLGPRRAAQEVGWYIEHLRNGFKREKSGIDFRIGETGWPSQGNSFNDSPNSDQNLVEYWSGINDWASRSRVQTQMFEAMNEPWKGQNSQWKAESHYGWWYKPNNNRNDHTYVEKATGRHFRV